MAHRTALWLLGLVFFATACATGDSAPSTPEARPVAGSGWSRLSNAPVARSSPVALWTGRELFYRGGETNAVAAPAPVPVLSFVPAPGWNVVTTAVPPQQVGNLQVAWAANVPLRGSDAATTWPLQTGKSLPVRGIVVFVSAARAVDDPDLYRPRSVPLTLADGYFLPSAYENQPAPNVSLSIIYARIEHWYVLVHVWYGTNDPTNRMREEADAQLTRLNVPSI